MVYAFKIIANEEAGLAYGLLNSKKPNPTKPAAVGIVVFSSTLHSHSFFFKYLHYEDQFLLLFPKKATQSIWMSELKHYSQMAVRKQS